eukprot:6467823-Amphidinium_carterae.1
MEAVDLVVGTIQRRGDSADESRSLKVFKVLWSIQQHDQKAFRTTKINQQIGTEVCSYSSNITQRLSKTDSHAHKFYDAQKAVGTPKQDQIAVGCALHQPKALRFVKVARLARIVAKLREGLLSRI